MRWASLSLDAGPDGRPVVLSGEEVGERLQPPEQVGVVPVARRASDRLAEFLAGVVLGREHAVDVTVEAQRADHVVRRADQVIPAQRLEPLVLLARLPGCLVPIRREPRSVELAEDLCPAELLLIGVDHVAAGQPEGAKRQPRLAHIHEIADDLAEEVVQWIMTRNVTDILPVHRKSFLSPLRGSKQSSQLPGICRALIYPEAPNFALIHSRDILRPGFQGMTAARRYRTYVQ